MNRRAGGRALSARAIEELYPPRGRFVPVTGGRLHVLERRPMAADGTLAIVLLHGASGNACDLGLDLFETLSRRWHVLSVDRPGHGWSDRPGGAQDADPRRQARLIRDGLHALGVADALVVAHSWSGGLALNLALDHADLVRGVVLAGGATHPWPGARISWYHRIGAHDRLGPPFAHAAAPLGCALLTTVLRSVFRPQVPPPHFVERTALPLLFRPSQFRANAQDMAGLHRFLTGQAPRYGDLEVPVTTIVSEHDRIVPMAHGAALAAQSRRVELKVLHGCGHMLQHIAVPAIVAAVHALAERLARRERQRLAS
jgi:pimeloyl-ACP methyl ester carboxylesterase